MLSIIVNAIIIILVIASVWADVKKSGFRFVFKFFTIQSNVFCAVTALMVIISRLTGGAGFLTSVLKYVGTTSVMVTFLTVFLFLGPTQKNWGVLLSGPELHLHLIVPLLALLSYLLWDKVHMPVSYAFFGVLPVILYGILYLKKVVFTSGDAQWDDFYGFNAGGHWIISFAAMLFATTVLSVVLVAVS